MMIGTYYPEIAKNWNDGRSSWLLADNFNQEMMILLEGNMLFGEVIILVIKLPLTDFDSDNLCSN